MKTLKDYSGQRKNKLVAINFSHRIKKRTYWNFKCDCGNEKVIRVDKVLSKHSGIISCGCSRNTFNSKDCGIGQNNETSSFNILFSHYKRSAKRRGYSFKLELNVFKKLTGSDCSYCGSKPIKTIHSIYNRYTYNGIDRLDNSIGYEIDNCVSCCTICNRAKKDLSEEEFFIWINKLIEFNK